MNALNSEVTQFLDKLQHPLRPEIELLRAIIVTAYPNLTENIKWNGPNYSLNNQDLLTMRIQPPKQIQLVLHRGAHKQTQPPDRLIQDQSGLLVWKENDRAVISFKKQADIHKVKTDVTGIVKDWITAVINS
jgi:hypothetical protein